MYCGDGNCQNDGINKSDGDGEVDPLPLRVGNRLKVTVLLTHIRPIDSHYYLCMRKFKGKKQMRSNGVLVDDVYMYVMYSYEL